MRFVVIYYSVEYLNLLSLYLCKTIMNAFEIALVKCCIYDHEIHAGCSSKRAYDLSLYTTILELLKIVHRNLILNYFHLQLYFLTDDVICLRLGQYNYLSTKSNLLKIGKILYNMLLHNFKQVVYNLVAVRIKRLLFDLCCYQVEDFVNTFTSNEQSKIVFCNITTGMFRICCKMFIKITGF